MAQVITAQRVLEQRIAREANVGIVGPHYPHLDPISLWAGHHLQNEGRYWLIDSQSPSLSKLLDRLDAPRSAAAKFLDAHMNLIQFKSRYAGLPSSGDGDVRTHLSILRLMRQNGARLKLPEKTVLASAHQLPFKRKALDALIDAGTLDWAVSSLFSHPAYSTIKDPYPVILGSILDEYKRVARLTVFFEGGRTSYGSDKRIAAIVKACKQRGGEVENERVSMSFELPFGGYFERMGVSPIDPRGQIGSVRRMLKPFFFSQTPLDRSLANLEPRNQITPADLNQLTVFTNLYKYDTALVVKWPVEK